MVETIRLESGHTLTGIVGSNPTLSAIFICLYALKAARRKQETAGLAIHSSRSYDLSPRVDATHRVENPT